MRHQVNIQAGPPVLIRRRCRTVRPIAKRNTRIGHKNVDRTKLGFRALNTGGQIGRIGHIHLQSQSVNFCGDFLRGVEIQVGYCDFRALHFQCPAQGTPDSMSATCNEGYAVIDFHLFTLRYKPDVDFHAIKVVIGVTMKSYV